MQLEYGAIKDLQSYVDAMPQAATEGARIALNDVVGKEGLALYRQAVLDQAAFPAGYLNDDRLGIEQKATNADLAITVLGRFRATSLARFIRQGNVPGKYGVTVEVHKGKVRKIERGFLVNLASGNKGLAIRLEPGERPTNALKPKKLRDGVFLLYGPSVDQLLGEAGDRETPQVLEKVEREFYRQFFRLVK